VSYTNNVTSGLKLALDASNSSSYPGSGSVWYDTSGNSNNFNINAGAWQTTGSIPYMNFSGSYGSAKRSAGAGDVPGLTGTSGVTYVLYTRVLNSSSTWRTLTRGWSEDHQVIIQEAGWNIGLYDQGSGFYSTGYSQQSLPGYPSDFDLWVVRWSNNDSPNTFDLNVNGVQRGTITNSNARYNNSFYVIGAYHNGNTDVNSNSQYWGDISYFAAYDRRLSDAEVSQINSEFLGPPPGPRISLSVSPTSVLENASSNLIFTFYRADTGVPVTSGTDVVSFAVSGNATYNVDYTVEGADSFSSSAGQITIQNGTANANLIIIPTPDADIEGTSNISYFGVDSVTITPANTTAGYLVVTSAVTGYIYDDDIGVYPVGGAGNNQLEFSVANLSFTSIPVTNITFATIETLDVSNSLNTMTTISTDSVQLDINLTYSIDFVSYYDFDGPSPASDNPIQVWTD
jgi:hypothetical protein